MTVRDYLGPRILLALALAVACGFVATWISLPLPWMLGPMIGCTVAALAGAPVTGPVRIRPYVIPVIGVLLGSSLTPEVVAAIPTWSITMLLLPPFLVVAAFFSYQIYARLGGMDRVTAYYSAMPGGLNEMIMLGEAAGGDDRRIAMAHACRVLLVILCVSLFFGLVLGVNSGGQALVVPLDALSLRDWLLMGAAAVLGVPLARRLRLPADQLTGPMILSGLLHLTGLVTASPPTLLVILAQLTIGTTLGCRFAGMHLRDIAYDLWLALLSTLSMIAIATLFAVIVTTITPMPMEQAFLAYSPGGLTEMSLLALALHQDVAYVAVTHVVRIIMVIAGAAAWFRWRSR